METDPEPRWRPSAPAQIPFQTAHWVRRSPCTWCWLPSLLISPAPSPTSPTHFCSPTSALVSTSQSIPLLTPLNCCLVLKGITIHFLKILSKCLLYLPLPSYSQWPEILTLAFYHHQGFPTGLGFFFFLLFSIRLFKTYPNSLLFWSLSLDLSHCQYACQIYLAGFLRPLYVSSFLVLLIWKQTLSLMFSLRGFPLAFLCVSLPSAVQPPRSSEKHNRNLPLLPHPPYFSSPTFNSCSNSSAFSW